MLELRRVESGYGFLQVLRGVSLRVEEGEFVALLGPNGAGKSTTLRTIAGIVAPSQGQIVFKGTPITGLATNRISRVGIGLVSEGLNLFTGMSVYENLMLGAYALRDGARRRRNLGFVFELFPRLAERRTQLAGTLSGGERKMLAIGRALMSEPTLLLVDEPSLGLAPKVSDAVFGTLERLRDENHTILLVEQNVAATLEIVDRAYVLEQGTIVLEGTAAELERNEHVRRAYMGEL